MWRIKCINPSANLSFGRRAQALEINHHVSTCQDCTILVYYGSRAYALSYGQPMKTYKYSKFYRTFLSMYYLINPQSIPFGTDRLTTAGPILAAALAIVSLPKHPQQGFGELPTSPNASVLSLAAGTEPVAEKSRALFPTSSPINCTKEW